MKKKPKIEDIVYLKTDSESKPRIITKYEVSKNSIVYYLMVSDEGSWHFEFEFTKEVTISDKIGF